MSRKYLYVVVFSEKAKSEEAERLKYSSSSAYWNPITLPTEPEISPQAKLKVRVTISILSKDSIINALSMCT
ncbi:hypothetical protein CDAR_428041 [Caerostris darwini]|uniref:Uncharacterized protein n=1 Tax=Caerostris darwini TaxID=1538125 RepID=A0AAV4VHM2_9ARAC|nr:hypothetical protein CDAR_428041 [Caerostris darwini]